MARLGRAQLKAWVVPTRAPQSIAYIQGASASFEVTTAGTVSFPVPAYLSGNVNFLVETSGQIVKLQELTSSVDFRVGWSAGQAYPVGLLLALTSPERGLTLQIEKGLTSTVVQSPTVSKGVSTTIVSTNTVAPSVNKGFFLTLASAGSVASTLAKRVGKPLSVFAPIASTMSSGRAYVRDLTATIASSATSSRVVSKPLSAISSISLVYTKAIFATKTVTSSVGNSVSKSVSKRLTVAQATVSTISRDIQIAIIQQVIAATSTVSAGIQKRVFKTISQNSTVTAFLIRVSSSYPEAVKRAIKARGGIKRGRGTSI